MVHAPRQLGAGDGDEWSGRDWLGGRVIRRGIFSPSMGASRLPRAIPAKRDQSARGLAAHLVVEGTFQTAAAGRYGFVVDVENQVVWICEARCVSP